MTTFNDILKLEQDTDFRERLRVAAQIAGVQMPANWVLEHALAVAALPEVNEPYSYARQTNPYHSRPGFDPVIITDDALLNATKKVLESVGDQTNATNAVVYTQPPMPESGV